MLLAETRDDAFMSELVTPGQEGLSPPLESLRHSVQGLVSGQLRGQMRLLFTRLSSLSRLGKVTLGAGAGLLFWWLAAVDDIDGIGLACGLMHGLIVGIWISNPNIIRYRSIK